MSVLPAQTSTVVTMHIMSKSWRSVIETDWKHSLNCSHLYTHIYVICIAIHTMYWFLDSQSWYTDWLKTRLTMESRLLLLTNITLIWATGREPCFWYQQLSCHWYASRIPNRAWRIDGIYASMYIHGYSLPCSLPLDPSLFLLFRLATTTTTGLRGNGDDGNYCIAFCPW